MIGPHRQLASNTFLHFLLFLTSFVLSVVVFMTMHKFSSHSFISLCTASSLNQSYISTNLVGTLLKWMLQFMLKASMGAKWKNLVVVSLLSILTLPSDIACIAILNLYIS